MATAADTDSAPRASALKRVALAALIAIVALNIWTGSPLLALWVGSRVQGSGPPSMAAVFVFFVLFAVLSASLLRVLSRLSAAYDSASGRPPSVGRHVPWLRSMRGERESGYAGDRPQLTATERILVGMVVVVVLIFEIWFFFFSTSPIDQRSGRVEVEPPVTADRAPREVDRA